MFEKEIEFIYNYYLNKIENLNSFVTFDQLASADLHPALLQYVSAEIDYLIYEDRQKLLKESLFDYSGSKINENFNQISEEIKLTKKFSKEYISKLLLHATSFNVNYVVRPNWSLLQFIFENEDEKYVAEVKQILNYLYYYPYYKRILINYFNKKHLYKITEEEMVSVLDKIDRINLESNIEEIVEESLSNIIHFVNSGEVSNNRISKGIIELFLIDKKIDEASTILDEELNGSSEDKFKIDEYKNIILNYLAEEVAEVSQPADEEDPASEEIIEEETVSTEDENVDNSIGETEVSEMENNSDIDENIDDDTDKLIETEEYEPPEFDEGPRVENTELQEVYDMVNEEEEIKDPEFEEDLSDGDRININDEVADSVLKELDEYEDNSESDQQEDDEKEEIQELESKDEDANKYVVQGTSVSFSLDELESQKSSEPIEGVEEADNSLVDELLTEIKAEENRVIADESDEENDIAEDTEFDTENSDDVSTINNEDIEISEPITIRKSIDVSELLNNRKVTKIIENVFDYDMEEFTKTIEKISECNNEDDALQIIDAIAHGSYLDESSREIKSFKKIISDLF